MFMDYLEKVTTRDGSSTFRNKTVGETYHSMSGAAQEALQKHVEPSGLLEKKEVVIGDVCFGLGYNSFVAMAKHKQKFPDGLMQIFAFENDITILQKIAELDYETYQPQADKMKLLLSNKIESISDYDLYLYEDDNLTITLYVGDLRKTVPILADNVLDVIFFDPFSPKKQPELWSQEVFAQMNRIMVEGAVLTTYSCARVTRTNMLANNFEVTDGPVVGRVSPGTIAKKVK